MVFQTLQLNVAIHEWIRHYRIRARRVVMVIAKKKRSKASGDKTLARVVRLMGEFDKTSYEDIDQKMRDEIEHADEVLKDIVTRKRQGKVNKTPARFRAAFLTKRAKCFVLSHM